MPKLHIWVHCVSLWVPEGQKTVLYLSISPRPASNLCVAQPCLKRGRESTLNSHYSVTMIKVFFFFCECPNVFPGGLFRAQNYMVWRLMDVLSKSYPRFWHGMYGLKSFDITDGGFRSFTNINTFE